MTVSLTCNATVTVRATPYRTGRVDLGRSGIDLDRDSISSRASMTCVEEVCHASEQ